MILPNDFERYFRERWRGEEVEALLAGLDGEPSVSIRVNPKRLPADAEPEGADGRVPWCPEGFYLKERPQFTADPLLHAGAYYVQEASSMFLSHALRTILHSSFFTLHSQAVLDLCAAPGGKSTLLRSLLPDDCLLVSNEPLRARAQVLAENLAKWGHPNVLVTQTYARDIAKALKGKQFFDLILADVPCSGEGMMRKEEEAVRQWSPAFVAECAALQRSIIEDIWLALRPGGVLIYSTCTFNPEEDEENVEWIARELGADILPVPVEPAWGIRGDMRAQATNDELRMTNDELRINHQFLHFLPGCVRGEGFFCAVLRKAGENGQSSKKSDFIASLSKLPALPTDPLDAPEAPYAELSLTDAVRYLQREALVLPPDVPRGIVQVGFQGHRLGLVKNLGTRANNLYPKEWRIRSSFITPHTLF
ncbi:MAG: hypothetical protein IJQ59_00895 [Bacteroidaceae bacterium]|nr:hypothetical protein [Bacteroidaceae bacterium]